MKGEIFMSKKLENLKNEFNKILKSDRKMKISTFKKVGSSAINNMYKAKQSVQKVRKETAKYTGGVQSAMKELEQLEEQSDNLFDEADDIRQQLSPNSITDLNMLKNLKPNPKFFVKDFGTTDEEYKQAFEELKKKYIIAHNKYSNNLSNIQIKEKNLNNKQEQIISNLSNQYQSKVIIHLNQALSDLNLYNEEVKHSKSSVPELQNEKTTWIKNAKEYVNDLIKKYSNMKRELDKIIILVNKRDKNAWKNYKAWEKFDSPLE